MQETNRAVSQRTTSWVGYRLLQQANEGSEQVPIVCVMESAIASLPERRVRKEEALRSEMLLVHP